MADDPLRIDEELRDLARDFDAQIGDRDLSHAVIVRLTGRDDARRRLPRRVAVAATVALLAGVCAVPPARAAVADLLRFGAERLHTEEPPPGRRHPAAVGLPDLGDPSTPTRARQRMDVVVPTAPGFEVPDQVWFAEVPGGRTSLVYFARPGLRPSAPTGIGLLVQEFGGDGRGAVDKYLATDTRAEHVVVGGHDGVFLGGATHAVWYEAPHGDVVTEVGRLAGHALIFQRGPLTIRIEGELPRDQMVAIGASLR